MERWRLGLLVPLIAAIATAALIVGIGELLLAVGEPVLTTVGNSKVHLATLVALAIAGAVLGLSTLASRGGAPSGE
jgi:hypothetical protein